MAISRNPKDIEARLTRVAQRLVELRASPGQELADGLSPTQQQIRLVIASWGKGTCYRYLRDHGMLEAFTQCLPMQDYAATDEATIVETLQAGWDDFSPEMLASMEAWQYQSSQAALTPKLASYAGTLHQQGYVQEALDVLHVAEQIDASSDVVSDTLTISELTTEHVVHQVGDIHGFGPDHLAARVTSTAVQPDGNVLVSVTIPQRDEDYMFQAPADRVVRASRLVRPHYSRSLRIAALRKLIAAESMLDGNEQAQSQVARVRYLLAESLKSEV